MAGPRTANGLDVEIGEAIRNERVKAGVSQEMLGEKVGVTFQQIQKYERGSNRIAASRLVLVARALERPVSAFLPRSRA